MPCRWQVPLLCPSSCNDWQAGNRGLTVDWCASHVCIFVCQDCVHVNVEIGRKACTYFTLDSTMLPQVFHSHERIVCFCSALMQDQVRNFNNRGIKADYYCSTRTARERASIEQGLQGIIELRLLFVTPETFSSEQYALRLLLHLILRLFILLFGCSSRALL